MHAYFCQFQILLSTYRSQIDPDITMGRNRKKVCNFEKLHCFPQKPKSTVFDTFFIRAAQGGISRVKAKFKKKLLILAFEVIMQPLVHTLFIAIFFLFLAHCKFYTFKKKRYTLKYSFQDRHLKSR